MMGASRFQSVLKKDPPVFLLRLYFSLDWFGGKACLGYFS